jgi:Fe-Mn family superoxide dismutase
MENKSLVDIIVAAREQSQVGVFNNAAQSWNHDFLWKSMSPNDDTSAEGQIAELVESEFGDIDGFKKAFKESALGQFGSGWTWLVLDGSRVRIMSTSNAETPVGTHLTPLLTLDVWEHAYYVDYKNERNRYVDAFLENLINWKFAAANLEGVEKAA